MSQRENPKGRKTAEISGRTPELIFITDSDLQVTYINQNVSKQIFPISETKSTRKITDYLPNLNIPNLKSKISELSENKISFETSYRINPGDKKKPELKLLISASNNDQNKHLLWKVVPRQKSLKSISKPVKISGKIFRITQFSQRFTNNFDQFCP
jgi:hypothetical protein